MAERPLAGRVRSASWVLGGAWQLLVQEEEDSLLNEDGFLATRLVRLERAFRHGLVSSIPRTRPLQKHVTCVPGVHASICIGCIPRRR